MALHCTFLTCIMLTMAMLVGAHGAKQKVRLVRFEVLSVDADATVRRVEAEDAAAAKKKGDYTFVHDGHCNGGWISGSNTRQVSIGACASQCRNRIQCAYFAFDSVSASGTNCALYEAGARCPDDARHPNYNSYRMEAVAPITTEKEIPKGTSNAGCNARVGQTNGPFTCEGKENFACVNIGYVIRHACQMCTQHGLMNSGEEDQCRVIAKGGQTTKGVKLTCVKEDGYVRHGCVETMVDSRWGWTDLGSNADKVCPCVKSYVTECKHRGLDCVLNKIDKCPHVCKRFKMRVNEARGSTLIEAKGDDKLKERADVAIGSRWKTSRNASASMMSLDNTMSGKCAV